MTQPRPTRFRPATLASGRTVEFSLRPEAEARAAIAERLGLLKLRKLSFVGTLRPEGPRDWVLEARLGATVTQPCIATLAPVTTRIDDDVTRRYLHDMPAAPAGDDVEIPEDDTLEPLPEIIVIDAVMEEALALALPLYPRAPGADPVIQEFAPPGATPIAETGRRPFEGLEVLKKRLEGDGGDTGG